MGVLPNSKSALGWLLRLPLKLIPIGLVLPVFSGQNKGFRWVVGTSVHGCWLGWYEREMQKSLAATTRPGMVAWDLGAQAGFYTLLFSRCVGPHGRVVALEPYEQNCRSIRRHLELNRIENATLIEAAASDKSGMSTFEASSNLTMGRIVSGAGENQVRTHTIDDLIAEGMPAPDVVKMDVEGAEVAVLRGAAALLARKRTQWFVAIHGEECWSGCADIFRASGYRILGIGGGPIPTNTMTSFECLAIPA